MKLVDASSWIEYLRARSSSVGDRVEVLLLGGEAAWCDLTLVELWHGVRGPQEKRKLEEMEEEIDRVAMDADAWRLACKLALRCRERGVTVPSTDIIVAACATHHGLELEHCDSHFDRILPIAATL